MRLSFAAIGTSVLLSGVDLYPSIVMRTTP